ncbi:MAG TPA: hypothetical protein PK609_01995 [Candidatus Paceibacterota bacterium]|nr:hypothetical protein [Candidatus Paceibacterota bacterium]
MGQLFAHLRGHILAYIILPLIIVSGVASFYRFVVANDYIVEYEGECDPSTESCFEGCEDDECLEPYPYKYMHKYASDVRAECGPDITECEDASVCLVGDEGCSIEYCDPEELGENESCFFAEEESLDSSEEDDSGVGTEDEGTEEEALNDE